MESFPNKFRFWNSPVHSNFFCWVILGCGVNSQAEKVAMDRTNPKSKFNWKTLQSNNRTMINIAPLAIWVPILFGLMVKKVQVE
jgi:hypothetical protein